MIALIFTTLMPLPFPARAPVNPAMRHAGRRERAPHRRPRLRPAGPRPRPAHRHARGRLRRRQDARRRPWPASRPCATAASALAWATRVDDATAAAVLERWPDAVVDAEARCAFVGDAAGAGRRGPGAHRRDVRRRRRRRGGRDPRRQRRRLPARGRRRGGGRAPRARRRPRPRRRPTRSWSSPGWTARCRAWSPA